MTDPAVFDEIDQIIARYRSVVPLAAADPLAPVFVKIEQQAAEGRRAALARQAEAACTALTKSMQRPVRKLPANPVTMTEARRNPGQPSVTLSGTATIPAERLRELLRSTSAGREALDDAARTNPAQVLDALTPERRRELLASSGISRRILAEEDLAAAEKAAIIRL